MQAGEDCVKATCIVGDPGAGKTTCMQLVLFSAMTMGLTCTVASLMSERSVELGGTHIHEFFSNILTIEVY